jgi:hypothetical protein
VRVNVADGRNASRSSCGAMGSCGDHLRGWLFCPSISAAGREGQRRNRIDATRSPVTRSDGPARVLMSAASAAVRRAIRDCHRLGSTNGKGDPKAALCVVRSWGYAGRFHHPPTTPSATRQRRSVDGSGTAAVPPPTTASTNGSTSNPSTAPSPFMSAGAS